MVCGREEIMEKLSPFLERWVSHWRLPRRVFGDPMTKDHLCNEALKWKRFPLRHFIHTGYYPFICANYFEEAALDRGEGAGS